MIKTAVLDGQRPSLDSIPFDIPAQFKKLVEECWSQDAQARPTFAGKTETIMSGYIQVSVVHLRVGLVHMHCQ